MPARYRNFAYGVFDGEPGVGPGRSTDIPANDHNPTEYGCGANSGDGKQADDNRFPPIHGV